MNVDQLLADIQGMNVQPRILAAVQHHLTIKICRYGSLLNALHELDLEIIVERDILHKQALLARHQMAEWNVKALVKEGNLGCRQCACCLQFLSRHHCLISELLLTGVCDAEF